MRDWCEARLQRGIGRDRGRSNLRQVGFVVGPERKAESERWYKMLSQGAVDFPMTGQIVEFGSRSRLKMGCCLGSNWSCLSKLRRNSKVNTEMPFWYVPDRNIRKLKSYKHHIRCWRPNFPCSVEAKALMMVAKISRKDSEWSVRLIWDGRPIGDSVVDLT